MPFVDWTEPTFDDLLAQRHSETSVAAAEAIKPRRYNLRERVLETLTIMGPMTDQELQAAMDLPGSTERPRRVELVRMGLVRECGRRRQQNGRMATIWEAV